MHVEEHEPLDELREWAGRQRRAREHRRFRAVELAQQGDTAEDIAAELGCVGCARRPVQAWVRRYNDGRAAGRRPPDAVAVPVGADGGVPGDRDIGDETTRAGQAQPAPLLHCQ